MERSRRSSALRFEERWLFNSRRAFDALAQFVGVKRVGGPNLDGYAVSDFYAGRCEPAAMEVDHLLAHGRWRVFRLALGVFHRGKFEAWIDLHDDCMLGRWQQIE